MRKLLLPLAGLMILVSSTVAAQSMCVSSGSRVTYILNYVKGMVSAPGSDSMSTVTRIASDLPLIADSATADTAVAVIASDSVCSAAALSFIRYAVDDTTAAPVPVTVIRVASSRYIVFDSGANKWGDREVFVILNALLAVVSAFVA